MMNSDSDGYLPIDLQLRGIGIFCIQVSPKPFRIGFLDYTGLFDIYIDDFSTFKELFTMVKQRLLETPFSKPSIVTILSYLLDHQGEIEEMLK
ncbi:MAG: hypothetical protein L0H53_10405 [Candidatus Nitrosocosmicus sp.]|nr:hypothetical protein [Candidatus Nitrosocosmicus sp.]MDN5867883.1 hypothetical protein [Candidatus Nitrosocosmicus sp.]